MANYSVTTSKHATLTANTVDTVTLTFAGSAGNVYPDQVEVLHRDTTASDPIYFRLDGTSPTVGGDDCYVVMPGGGLSVPYAVSPVVVKLKSAGAMPYSVTIS